MQPDGPTPVPISGGPYRDVLYVRGDMEAAMSLARDRCASATTDERVPFVVLEPNGSTRTVLCDGVAVRPSDVPLTNGAHVWLGDLSRWDGTPGARKAVGVIRDAQALRDARDGRRPCFTLEAWLPEVDPDFVWHDTNGIGFARVVDLTRLDGRPVPDNPS